MALVVRVVEMTTRSICLGSVFSNSLEKPERTLFKKVVWISRDFYMLVNAAAAQQDSVSMCSADI